MPPRSEGVREVKLSFEAATNFVDGAIIIDEYDDVVFDDVLRRFPVWSRVDKREAPGETTGGFDQTAVGAARSADPRSLGFTAVSPTRSARTRKDIRAIVMNRTFGMFDLSVGRMQGRYELKDTDVRDLVTGCMQKWNAEFYEGDNSLDTTEFSGLRKLLGAGTDIAATASIANGLDDQIITMLNTDNRDIMPTAIYCNAKVIQMLAREYEKVGDKLQSGPWTVNGNTRQVYLFPSSAGFLPLIEDKYNKAIAGTPDVYPTFIVSEDKLSWQYVEPIGYPGPDPKTFEINLQNDLDQDYTCVMFGALELLGGTTHHVRMNVEYRSTVVDMTS